MKKIAFFEGFMTRNHFILKIWAVIHVFRVKEEKNYTKILNF